MEPPQGTALLLAIQLNSLPIIQLLVTSGAWTDIKDTMDQGVLHIAALCASHDTISLLTTLGLKGVHLEDRDTDGLMAWQLFDQARPYWLTEEDPATRVRSREVFERLVESILPADETAASGTNIVDMEDESMDSDLDEFFENK